MKSLLSNILIAIDLMSCKLVRNLITVLLLIAGFVLCGMTLICVNISDYDRIEYNKQCDITRTGCMANDNVEEPIYNSDERIDLLKQQPYQQFYNNLKKSGFVEKCAQYSILGHREVDKDIIKIQEGHQIENYAGMGCVECIFTQKDIFDIYNIKIEPKVNREDWCADGIIMGNKFREKYGDVEYINYMGKKCKLLGFVEDNQKLSFEEIAYEDGTALTALYNLDYAFFQLVSEDSYSGHEIHFRLAKGVTKDEFQNKANEMAKKDKATIVSMYFIDDHLAEFKKYNLEILGNITEFAIALLVGITLICIVVKVESILCNKKLYGILYSSGLTTNQINSLFVFENFIILFFSLIVAYLCLYNGIYIFTDYFGQQAARLLVNVVKSVLVSKVFLQEFLICFSMVIITSGIPMIVFSNLSPLSMMKDFYE